MIFYWLRMKSDLPVYGLKGRNILQTRFRMNRSRRKRIFLQRRKNGWIYISPAMSLILLRRFIRSVQRSDIQSGRSYYISHTERRSHTERSRAEQVVQRVFPVCLLRQSAAQSGIMKFPLSFHVIA